MKQSQSNQFISWPNFILMLLGAAVVFFLISLLSGCYTEKKAIKQVDKAIVIYPVPSSQEFRRFFPCVISGSSFVTDSTAYKNSLDSLTQSKAFYELLIASVNVPVEHNPLLDSVCADYLKEIDRLNKKLDYQDNYIIELTDDFNHIEPVIINHYDTTEDLGKVMEKDAELQLAKRELQTVKTDLQIAEKKVKKQRGILTKIYISLGILLLLIGGWFYFSIKKRGIKKVIGL